MDKRTNRRFIPVLRFLVAVQWEAKGGEIQMNRKQSIELGVWFAILLAITIASHPVVAQNLPPNAALATAAWNAFNKGDWSTAIHKADACITQFQDQADDQQAELEKKHAIVPSGTVSKQAGDEIVKRGPLNDVATVLWIKGQSLEKLGKTEDAKQAYHAAAKYTYARCYDASWDGFWSPSENALRRLRHL
jgi:hypothetical protein